MLDTEAAALASSGNLVRALECPKSRSRWLGHSTITRSPQSLSNGLVSIVRASVHQSGLIGALAFWETVNHPH